MRIILLAVLAITLFSNKGNSQDFKLGIGSEVFFTDNTYIALQGRALYEFNDKYGISGNANFHIGENSGWSADFDMLYTLLNINDGFELSPFGGINVDEGISLNIGANIAIPLNDKTLYAAPKFIIDKSSFFALSIGVLF
jgi:hypothetical protein